MQVNFPSHIKQASEALRCACSDLSNQGIWNYIYDQQFVVEVAIGNKDNRVTPIIDFTTHTVLFPE